MLSPGVSTSVVPLQSERWTLKVEIQKSLRLRSRHLLSCLEFFVLFGCSDIRLSPELSADVRFNICLQLLCNPEHLGRGW